MRGCVCEQGELLERRGKELDNEWGASGFGGGDEGGELFDVVAVVVVSTYNIRLE